MDALLEQSQAIVQQAIEQLQPYATVMMISGGNDSLTAYHVARRLGIHIDAICHVVTGTGIQETADWVRQFGEAAPEKYLEANAGNAYEDYVLRKGFFGRGHTAHTYAYHLLKADGYRAELSRHIRQGKRGRRIMLLNGARQDESDNRMFTMREPIQQEKKGSPNWWVNIINHWSANDCQRFLGEIGAETNIVAKCIHRSGECMCGTMQSQAEREEAAYWYPDWGAWLDDLERRVMERFPWRWGEDVPKWVGQESAGQLRLFDFQPMCSSCKNNSAL